MSLTSANFAHLTHLESGLAMLGAAAKCFFARGTNRSILRRRQSAEPLAHQDAEKAGLVVASGKVQAELLARIKTSGRISREVEDVFHTLRGSGNDTIPAENSTVLQGVKLTTELLDCAKVAKRQAQCVRWKARRVGTGRQMEAGGDSMRENGDQNLLLSLRE